MEYICFRMVATEMETRPSMNVSGLVGISKKLLGMKWTETTKYVFHYANKDILPLFHECKDSY